jgi:hypothetical protein
VTASNEVKQPDVSRDRIHLRECTPVPASRKAPKEGTSDDWLLAWWFSTYPKRLSVDATKGAVALVVVGAVDIVEKRADIVRSMQRCAQE